MKKNEIKELTSIRFIAALHVVLFHNINLMGSNLNLVPHWVQSAISYGYCGVTFFFILSGFILTYVYSENLEQHQTSNSQFYYARFSRIYPIYLLAFFLDLPRGMAYFINQQSLLKMFFSAFAHLTMLQSWHPRLNSAWNSPAWSLSTEAFFYAIFPFVLPYILKSKKNFIFILTLYLIPLFVYSIIVFFLKMNIELGFYEVLWRSFPLIRVFEFMIGIYIGKIFLYEHNIIKMIKKNSLVAGYFFWFLAIGSLAVISRDIPISPSLFPNLILVPIFSLMILILVSIKVPMAFLFRNRIMLLLGSSSYALYIFHRPIGPYIENLTDIIPFTFTGSSLVIYLALLIPLSIGAYIYIEKPAQKLLRLKISSPMK